MRRRLSAILLLVALAVPLAGAAPPARMPAPGPAPIVVPVVVPPAPPVPPPATRLTLASDVLWVAQSDGPFIVDASPEGLVSVTWETGPIRVRGRFVEDPAKVQTRTFASKYVCTVEALQTGKCELLIRPDVAGGKVQRVCLDVVVGPGPGPGPDPPPPPPPPLPPPGPAPVKDMRVLILYETSEVGKLSAGQKAVLYSKTIRDYLDAKCVDSPGGKTKEWKLWDKDVDARGASKVWQDLLARPRATLPWLIVSGEKGVAFEGPLPASIADTLALLSKYAPVARRKGG